MLKENFVTTSETWKGWAVKVLVTNPVKWTFNTVKNIIIGKNVQSDLEYIHIPVLKVRYRKQVISLFFYKEKLKNPCKKFE